MYVLNFAYKADPIERRNGMSLIPTFLRILIRDAHGTPNIVLHFQSRVFPNLFESSLHLTWNSIVRVIFSQNISTLRKLTTGNQSMIKDKAKLSLYGQNIPFIPSRGSPSKFMKVRKCT